MSIDFDWLGKEILDRNLGEDDRSALDAVMTTRDFAKGETIVSQGQPGGILYILRSGTADVETDVNGERLHIAGANEGALFGEMTFLTKEAASAHVTAKQDCVVYKVTRDGLSQLMADHQELVYALVAYMLFYSSKVIRDMNKKHISMLHYITGKRL
ncbi:MAG: hypothetical protein BMS9Abin18_1072 [Zetaproteobacteria bacterium]|nr:MAG: hypothetical protein BMS9Abin18_1072 [Zetaproteobacteria bacterium]